MIIPFANNMVAYDRFNCIVRCIGLGAKKLWSFKTGFNVGGLITCDTFTVALYSLLQDVDIYFNTLQ